MNDVWFTTFFFAFAGFATRNISCFIFVYGLSNFVSFDDLYMCMSTSRMPFLSNCQKYFTTTKCFGQE